MTLHTHFNILVVSANPFQLHLSPTIEKTDRDDCIIIYSSILPTEPLLKMFDLVVIDNGYDINYITLVGICLRHKIIIGVASVEDPLSNVINRHLY